LAFWRRSDASDGPSWSLSLNVPSDRRRVLSYQVKVDVLVERAIEGRGAGKRSASCGT
jgi:hypothetical protein